jgi:GH24 family phage-related lysozyme (muramidase)
MAFERMGGFFENMRDLFRGDEKPFSGTESKTPSPPPDKPPVETMQKEMTNNAMSDYMSKTQQFEGGHKEEAYLDSLGKPTIGTGSLLENTSYSEMPEKYRGMRVSEEEGNRRFQGDYKTKSSEVEKLYGDKWGNLPEEVKGVMTDMAYNVGSEGLFNKFPGFVKDIQSGNYGKAAKNLKYKDASKGDEEGNVSNWWNQVGGGTTEERIASGEWAENSRAANRATANYDVLSGLGNSPDTQPIDDTMTNYKKSDISNYLQKQT